MKEQQRYRQKKNFSYTESKANTAQLLKKGRDSEILLPPLSPPDYKTIKQAEAEKAKIQAKKVKETEERLHAKAEQKKMLYDKISQALGSKQSSPPSSSKTEKTPQSPPNPQTDLKSFSQQSFDRPSSIILEKLDADMDHDGEKDLRPQSAQQIDEAPKQDSPKKFHVVFEPIVNEGKPANQRSPALPIQKPPIIKKTFNLQPRKESPRNSARSEDTYSYYSDDEYYYSDS